MSKAYDVMTQNLATVTPDEPVSRVAKIMHDRDIGNVLIVEDGRLRGIVTDRDLALQALTDNGENPNSPISRFMNTKVVTGLAGWSLDKVANTMARHQIRRLPIIEDNQLVGIISLSDIATHNVHKNIVTRLLRGVSTPSNNNGSWRGRNIGTWLGLSLAALTSGAIAWLTWTHSGQQWRKQMEHSKPYLSATEVVNNARDKVNEVASSKRAQQLRRQVGSNIKELSTQLPTIQYKPPRRKSFIFK